jgi:predicted house-cleaning noncanonical NTP pyrophosphatase (MazG superfamily)
MSNSMGERSVEEALSDGYDECLAMVLDVVGSMYNSNTFDNATLEELRQRIV